MRWSLAVIAGGGIAGAVQTTTTLTRLGSTAASGGLANPLVATGELAGAVGISLAGILMPLLFALAMLVVIPVFAVSLWRTYRRRTTLETA